jgi:hypothetical protein
MSLYRLNIFDQFGNLSKNLGEAEIGKCSLEQQAILFPLLEAWTETQAADEYCVQVEADKRKAETALAKAERVLETITPKWTAHQEWQVTVAKMPRPEPDPTVTKKINSATKVVVAARTHLDTCIAAVNPAKQARDEKRAIFADLLRKWSQVDGSAKSVGELIKERARVEAEQKMANVAKGLPPDYVEHMASTVGNSHLDRFKAGQGKGGSANFGYSRNSMRGATIKLPSQN